jgi:putative ABC transport system permease protein
MIVFLAARNVVRRTRRSLLVAGLIAVAVALLFFGNSILESTDAGLSRSFAESFTGDLAVAAISSRSFGVFGDETPAIGEYTPLPVIREFPAVMEILSRFPQIERATPLISGAAVVDLGGTRRSLPVFGIDASTYFQTFPRLALIEGTLIKPGQAGALISSARAKEIETRGGRQPSPGDPVRLSMFGKRGFRIEEVPLAGIVDFEISNPLLESTVLVDAQTLRALLGLTLAQSTECEPPEEAVSLLGADMEGLFEDTEQTLETSREELTLQEVRRLLSEPSDAPEELDPDSGGWHFILLRLNPGANPARVLKRLNCEFEIAGLPAAGMDWRRTAGMSARLVVLLRLVYNVGFLLFALAAIVVIVNLLVIEVIERSAEIGIVRALGADEGFVWRLLLAETTLLSLFGGLMGVLLGGALVLLLRSIRLQPDNRLLQTLFGGGMSNLTVSPMIALVSILIALAIGFLSCLYPVSLALRVQPARALSSK